MSIDPFEWAPIDTLYSHKNIKRTNRFIPRVERQIQHMMKCIDLRRIERSSMQRQTERISCCLLLLKRFCHFNQIDSIDVASCHSKHNFFFHEEMKKLNYTHSHTHCTIISRERERPTERERERSKNM